MFKNNRNLLIISLIAVVNALGYGIIIPILYSYSRKFGLTDFENGLLFAIFSAFQFLSTPIIGRMSDKYGRKPLLVISIAGTALSFLLMAFAPSAIFLFLARALDGITAGNIPVASAVITDTTEMKDRAKGFGIIGAAFGFGFIVGPAISAATIGYSMSYPFFIAAGISVIAVILTAVFLPETNKHIGEVQHSKLFDFSKLFRALMDKNVGLTLLITLVYSIAFSMIIYGYQPYSIKHFHLTPNQISLLFTVFGTMGLISQLLIVGKLSKIFGVKKSLSSVLILMSFVYTSLFLAPSLLYFVIASIGMGFVNSTIMPLNQTILSRETDVRSQGTIQGINSSYMSIGQIIGPILGGTLATTLSLGAPFLGSAVCALIALYLSIKILRRIPKVHTF